MGKGKNIWLRKMFHTLAVPLAVWAVMECLCRLGVGVGVINSAADLKNLARTWASTFCVALALSCNVTSGRMDLSLGAQSTLAAIIGGNLALRAGMGGSGILVVSVLVGMLAGGVVGLLYVRLKILPMILGIGMALVYECISFVSFHSGGLGLFGVEKAANLSEVSFIILVMAVIMIIMSYMQVYSSFGYDYRAIQGNQRIAMNSGINIGKNAVICYTLAGGLVAVSGVFNAAYSGQLMPELGMSSSSRVFSNMFPMFLGIYIGRWTNPVVGIFFSSLAIKFLTIGLAKFPMDSSIQQLISASLFLLFLVFQNNEKRVRLWKKKKQRVKEVKGVYA